MIRVCTSCKRLRRGGGVSLFKLITFMQKKKTGLIKFLSYCQSPSKLSLSFIHITMLYFTLFYLTLYSVTDYYLLVLVRKIKIQCQPFFFFFFFFPPSLTSVCNPLGYDNIHALAWLLALCFVHFCHLYAKTNET